MKSFFFAALILSLIPAFLGLSAVESRDIESIRDKKVLDDADLQIIDKFIGEGITEILDADDFSSIVNLRLVILANSASSQPGQVQFSEQFSKSAKKYIANALQTADGLTPRTHRFRVLTNILMLLDGLGDVRLIDLPLKYIDNEDEVVRYWAVKCLVSPKIIEGVNAQENDRIRQIIQLLEKAIPISGPDTLNLIADFAGSINIPDGGELLLKVADRRIASYADWTVENELIDSPILSYLSVKIVDSNPNKAQFAQRYGQLLAYAFQRYIKGINLLNPTQKEQLASVLIETEKSYLSKLIGQSSDIKKAIEAGGASSLVLEYNKLFGDKTKPGRLATEFNFNYGKDNTGAVLTNPLELAYPAQTSDSQNETDAS